MRELLPHVQDHKGNSHGHVVRSSFKEMLDIAFKQGEFAQAYAKLIVHNQIAEFADVTTRPDFDIALMWDEGLVEEYIQHQRRCK